MKKCKDRKNSVKPFLLMFFLLSSAISLNAQNNGIELSVHSGKVLEIYTGYPKTNAAYSIDLNFRSFGDTSKIWASLWNFPETGINLSLVSLGNPDVLGQSFSVSYQFSLQQKFYQKWSFSETFNFGLAYFNKDHHYIDNPGNIVIGSPFAAQVRIDLKLRYHLNKKWNAFIGVSLQHNSNGHTELPNIGINYPAILIGSQYLIKTNDAYLHTPNKIYKASKKWNLNTRLAFGINKFGSEVIAENGPSYPIYLISIYTDKRIWKKSRLQLTLDFYHNTGYSKFLESQEIPELKSTFGNASVLAFMIGNEFLYGHLGFVIQLGVYLHNPFLKYYVNLEDDLSLMGKMKAYIPGRFGFQYYLYDHFSEHKNNAFIGAYIKSNVGQADFFEMSMGYRF
jgi:hypothetical protein